MVNQHFWQHPPWQGGTPKQRLGLKPLALSEWLSQPISVQCRLHKQRLLEERYADVVAVLPHSNAAQLALKSRLAHLTHFSSAPVRYADDIANLAAQVSDDLCLLDVDDDQRLIAACLCSPSYWRLSEKLGQPLWAVHGGVPGLNRKIGANIDRFIRRAPIMQPFVRCNWFFHGDALRFHLNEETQLPSPVAHWYIRSERQTLCKISARYLLFTIDVVTEPLADLVHFVEAAVDLNLSLQRMDEDEVQHFGGVDKHCRLMSYVQRIAGSRTARQGKSGASL